MIARYSVVLQDDPDKKRMRNPAQIRKRNKLVRELAESLDAVGEEVQVLDRPKLFWVARDMVPVAVTAATTLPEWTPDLALTADAGFLSWARPAGTIPFAGHERVPWEDAWCGGVATASCKSRWARGSRSVRTSLRHTVCPHRYGLARPCWSIRACRARLKSKATRMRPSSSASSARLGC